MLLSWNKYDQADRTGYSNIHIAAGKPAWEATQPMKKEIPPPNNPMIEFVAITVPERPGDGGKSLSLQDLIPAHGDELDQNDQANFGPQPGSQ